MRGTCSKDRLGGSMMGQKHGQGTVGHPQDMNPREQEELERRWPGAGAGLGQLSKKVKMWVSSR